MAVFVICRFLEINCRFLLFFHDVLPEGIGEELDFYLGVDALVQYIIYGIEDGHVDMAVAVNLLHTLGAEIALGNHLHLNLGTLDAVALANHGAEGAVAREVGVARDEEVAHIDAVGNVALERTSVRLFICFW